jgi:hypothetical protein
VVFAGCASGAERGGVERGGAEWALSAGAL